MTHPFTLDAQALLKRHADWWQGKGTLFSIARGEPLGDLWLPLADGTLATEDLIVRPEMLDLDRLAGPPLEEMVPTFRKILGVKPLLLEGPPAEEELSRLWDMLPSDGLAINAWQTGW